MDSEPCSTICVSCSQFTFSSCKLALSAYFLLSCRVSYVSNKFHPHSFLVILFLDFSKQKCKWEGIALLTWEMVLLIKSPIYVSSFASYNWFGKESMSLTAQMELFICVFFYKISTFGGYTRVRFHFAALLFSWCFNKIAIPYYSPFPLLSIIFIILVILRVTSY